MILLLVLCAVLLTLSLCLQAFVVYSVYRKWQQQPLMPAPVTDFLNAPWREEPEHYA